MGQVIRNGWRFLAFGAGHAMISTCVGNRALSSRQPGISVSIVGDAAVQTLDMDRLVGVSWIQRRYMNPYLFGYFDEAEV